MLRSEFIFPPAVNPADVVKSPVINEDDPAYNPPATLKAPAPAAVAASVATMFIIVFETIGVCWLLSS